MERHSKEQAAKEASKKLLFCPFCGGSAGVNLEEASHYSANVRCLICSACTGEFYSEVHISISIDLAIEAWNRRHDVYGKSAMGTNSSI